jgi:hypothetical protein
MIKIWFITCIIYLIFFKNLKGNISYSNAFTTGPIGVILWLLVRVLSGLLIITYIISQLK